MTTFFRVLLTVILWTTLVAGFLAMPAAVIVGAEDAPMPAAQLVHKKHLARTVLFAGGALAAASACGLYAIHRPNRRRR